MRHAVLAGGLGLWLAGALGAQPPAAPDEVRRRLNESPRHQEWARIPSGPRTVEAFVVFPETDHKALAVVVIHENRGLTDWVRRAADRLAEAGYLAIAPDLLSGMGPGGGGTRAFASPDSARQALYELPSAQVQADLQATARHVAGLPACSGKVAVAGFCWGGAQAFSFATVRPDLAAAFVFYGRAPEQEEALARIACPVYGFYGGDDARINATLPATEEAMRRLGKTFAPVVYPGARHAFLRAAEEPGAATADTEAIARAWERWLALLAEVSGQAAHEE
ncbi:MAG: dienelactone hydrolase family protein [Candidatus Latescibacterota bacterium]